tara:strand:+ start:1619 stop:2545 length:927 start_codon:yes stop_codon:yes gene_type:complete
MDLKDCFYISEKDWYRLQAWAKLAYDEDKNEISGLMTAVPQKDGRIKVGDVEILKQENSGTNTELDGDAVSAYMMKYGMKYNNPDMKFVWWHSHHTMGAFWSGTDENEIEAWKNESYSLALVINLKEEYLFRVSFWKMNGLPVEYHEDTTLTIERKEPKIQISDSMKKQYEELCSERTIGNAWKGNSYGGYMNYQHNNVRQTNIWHREQALSMEAAYVQACEKAETMQDAFVDGSMPHKEWKEQVKEVNKTCEEKKFPFKMIEHKCSKHELINKLMTAMPSELFEWDDNVSRERAETYHWNSGGFQWQ